MVYEVEGAMTFTKWLLKQAGRRDPVGDLADDVQSSLGRSKYKERPSEDTHTAWYTYLLIEHACDGALEALDRAWVEYSFAYRTEHLEEAFQDVLKRRAEQEELYPQCGASHHPGDEGLCDLCRAMTKDS